MSIWYTTEFKFKGSPENLSKLIDELVVEFPEKGNYLRRESENGQIEFTVDGRFSGEVVSDYAIKYNLIGGSQETNDMEDQEEEYTYTWSIYNPATGEWSEEKVF